MKSISIVCNDKRWFELTREYILSLQSKVVQIQITMVGWLFLVIALYLHVVDIPFSSWLTRQCGHLILFVVSCCNVADQLHVMLVLGFLPLLRFMSSDFLCIILLQCGRVVFLRHARAWYSTCAVIHVIWHYLWFLIACMCIHVCVWIISCQDPMHSICILFSRFCSNVCKRGHPRLHVFLAVLELHACRCLLTAVPSSWYAEVAVSAFFGFLFCFDYDLLAVQLRLSMSFCFMCAHIFTLCSGDLCVLLRVCSLHSLCSCGNLCGFCCVYTFVCCQCIYVHLGLDQSAELEENRQHCKEECRLLTSEDCRILNLFCSLCSCGPLCLSLSNRAWKGWTRQQWSRSTHHTESIWRCIFQMWSTCTSVGSPCACSKACHFRTP